MEGSFVSAVVVLRLVCDPLGNVPIVVGAPREVPPKSRRRVILGECLIAFVILVSFAFFGRSFLVELALRGIRSFSASL